MATADEFICKVRSYLGVRYTYGGDTPEEGFDCSGLFFWCASQLNLPMPRTSQQQWAFLPHTANPHPGDLVFFTVPSDGGVPPQHVGMVIGGGQMIDAPHTGTVVRVDAIFPGVIGYGHPAFVEMPPPPINPPDQPPAPPIITDLGDDVQKFSVTLTPGLDKNGDGYYVMAAVGLAAVKVEDIVSVVFNGGPPPSQGYPKVPTWVTDQAQNAIVLIGGIPGGKYNVSIFTDTKAPATG